MLDKIYEKVLSNWNERTQKAIEEFVKIPALSIAFDSDWQKNGKLDEAVAFAENWAKDLGFPGIKMEKIQENGFPPCLYVDIPGTGPKKEGKTVFLYGHLDKQPPNTGWDSNKSAWKPVVENNRLYGRGAADDGYSWFCSLSALKALDEAGIDRPRCVGLFETAEESGSEHYPEYLRIVKDRLGDVGLIIVLDSSCGDYERLWITQSLRGMLGCVLKVSVLKHGVHSGEAGGVVPSSFMILRSLLDRVENSSTGEVLLKELKCDIPEKIVKQTQEVVDILGDKVNHEQPWAGSTHSLKQDALDSWLNRNWRPALSVVGAEGLPSVKDAGNVLRAETALKIGVRLPPLVDAEKAAHVFERVLSEKPPFDAEVEVKDLSASPGWCAPSSSPWISKAMNASSEKYWGKPAAFMGIGASIPLLTVFSDTWPEASFMVAGVLGPNSNAHGPNEFLDLEFAKRLTATVGAVVSAMPVAKE